MKTCTPELAAFLNAARQGLAFDLWTFTLQSGFVLRWTDADIDIAIAGGQFVRGPIISRDRVKCARGLEVDQLGVTLSSPTQLIGSQALPQFAVLGGFDGAAVQLERVYFDTSGAAPVLVNGALLLFVGTVSDTLPSRMGAKLTVKSQLAQLQQQLPRNVYQAPCMNNLFDSNCGVNRAANTVSGSITSIGTGSNPTLTVSLQGTASAGYFDLGIVKMTSGVNEGIGRTVQAQGGSGNSITLQFARPLPFALAVGDTFTATAGCNKPVTTCGNKFNNLIRFRGQPFIPVPETTT
jgi:uncharacterized phage protein (TIGR02218 family)